MEELEVANRSFSGQDSDIEAGTGAMYRMRTDTSVMSITSRDLTEARWYTLETMILEERERRTKDIAELQMALAELQGTAPRALCNPKTSDGCQGQASDFVGETSLACGGSTYSEVCVAPRRAKNVCDNAMQGVNELIAELHQTFASQLQDVEAKFHAQTGKQMALLESSLESMKRLQNQMQELEPAKMPKSSTETSAPITAKAQALLSQGPLPHNGQASVDQKNHEQSLLHLQGILKSSRSAKELIFTPRPATSVSVGIARSACIPCQMQASPPPSPVVSVAALSSPILGSREIKRAATVSKVRTAGVKGPVVVMQGPASPQLSVRPCRAGAPLPFACNGYPRR